MVEHLDLVNGYNIIQDTVKHVYNDTPGTTKMCCYNQVVVVTRTFSTEIIESVPAMCCCREVDVVNSDFLTNFDCIYPQTSALQ